MSEHLILLLFLMIKHFLADFVFQGRYIIDNRRHYGHPGGLLHVGIHGAGTLLAFAVAGVGWGGFALGLILVEVAVHYHIDWAKDNLNNRLGLGFEQGAYWTLMGFDQLLHSLTYLAIVWILIAV